MHKKINLDELQFKFDTVLVFIKLPPIKRYRKQMRGNKEMKGMTENETECFLCQNKDHLVQIYNLFPRAPEKKGQLG